MTINLGIEFLAREVCYVVRRLCGEHQTWIDLDRLESEEGIALPPTLLDAAVALAVARRWLVIAGSSSGEVRLRLANATSRREAA